jgi:hypothetical protein
MKSPEDFCGVTQLQAIPSRDLPLPKNSGKAFKTWATLLRLMNQPDLVRLFRFVATSTYTVLAVLPLPLWFFASLETMYSGFFTFTLGSFFLTLPLVLYPVWAPFLLLAFSSFLFLPIFYAIIATCLYRRGKTAWKVAFATNILTIAANIGWLARGSLPFSGQSMSMAQAGVVFYSILTIILLFYWKIALQTPSTITRR